MAKTKTTKTTKTTVKPVTKVVTPTVSQASDFLEDLFLKKAPAIPENIKEVIVKYGPYLSLVILIISLPALLFAFSVNAFMMPLSYLGGSSSGMHFSFSSLFMIVTLVLEALAIPGLFKRTRSGWNFVYYATILNAVYSLVNFNLFNLLVSTGLSLWVLYQIRGYYTK